MSLLTNALPRVVSVDGGDGIPSSQQSSQSKRLQQTQQHCNGLQRAPAGSALILPAAVLASISVTLPPYRSPKRDAAAGRPVMLASAITLIFPISSHLFPKFSLLSPIVHLVFSRLVPFPLHQMRSALNPGLLVLRRTSAWLCCKITSNSSIPQQGFIQSEPKNATSWPAAAGPAGHEAPSATCGGAICPCRLGLADSFRLPLALAGPVPACAVIAVGLAKLLSWEIFFFSKKFFAPCQEGL